MGPGSDTSLKGFFMNHRCKKLSLPLSRTNPICCSVNKLAFFFASEAYKIGGMGRDEGEEES